MRRGAQIKAAVEVLEELREELAARNIEFRLYSTYGAVRDMIRRAGHGDLLTEPDADSSPREHIQRWIAQAEAVETQNAPG